MSSHALQNLPENRVVSFAGHPLSGENGYYVSYVLSMRFDASQLTENDDMRERMLFWAKSAVRRAFGDGTEVYRVFWRFPHHSIVCCASIRGAALSSGKLNAVSSMMERLCSTPCDLSFFAYSGDLDEILSRSTQTSTVDQSRMFGGCLDERPIQMQEFMNEIETRLIPALTENMRIGYGDKAKEVLNTVRQRIIHYRISAVMQRYIFARLCYTLLDVLKSQNVPSAAGLDKSFWAASERLECFEQGVGWLYSLVDAFINSAGHRKLSIDCCFVEKIKRFVEANIEKQISLITVADHFSINASYLSRLFKAKTGINYHDYVTDIKLQRTAQLLLSHTFTKVEDVANVLGYFDPSYFNRVFKKRFGVTPLQYRKANFTG